MLKKLLVLVAVVLFVAPLSSADWALDFEWGLGHDGEVISSGVPGLEFTTTAGYDWVYGDITTNGYNTHSIDMGYGSGQYDMYGYVFAWLGPNAGQGKISFLNGDGGYFETRYCALYDFYLEAYDINNNLLDSDVGPGNLYEVNTMGTLRVESAGNDIAYVLMHDSGNFWEIDNISGDATGVSDPGNPIPEPGTLLLLGTGLLGLGAFLRRK